MASFIENLNKKASTLVLDKILTLQKIKTLDTSEQIKLAETTTSKENQEKLLKLAQYPSNQTSYQYLLIPLLKNPNLHPLLQIKAFKSRYNKSFLAGNTGLILRLQEEIVKEKNEEHIAPLAENPALGVRLQKELFTLNQNTISRNLANNSNLCFELQTRLLVRDYDMVVVSLLMNPNVSPIVQKEQGEKFPSALSLNPALSLETQISILQKALERADYVTILYLAQNENLFLKTSKLLLKTAEEATTDKLRSRLKKRLGENPSSPWDATFPTKYLSEYKKASFEKHIQSLPEMEKDFVEKLAGTWEGSLETLLAAAKYTT